MKRKQIIFEGLKKLNEDLTKEQLMGGKISGYDAETIGSLVKISRNTVSKELTELCDEGLVVKIKSRPVQFLCRESLERILDVRIEASLLIVKDIKEILDIYCTGNKNIQMEDPFAMLIGYDKSLSEAVEKAKAAVLYPPNGLNIMLSGNSGVGKTLFAEHIYEYAVKSGVISEDSQFVYFNCSEYYDNPELLTSHLFGHKTGAFTGALKDTEGLVKKAEGGYLFLDEVHRLSSESQEKLFSILDKGVYRKLGSDKEEQSSLRLICATTENLKSSFLTTFLRRIQVVIELPNLQEKSDEERLELILKFFYNESKKINAEIRISYGYLFYLMTNQFEANIGEIKSEIQFTCAQAYVNKISTKNDYILVDDKYIKRKMAGEHYRTQEMLNTLFRTQRVSHNTYSYKKDESGQSTYESEYFAIYPDKDTFGSIRNVDSVDNHESDLFYFYLSQEYKNLRNGNISVEETTSLLMNKLEAIFRYNMNRKASGKVGTKTFDYKVEEKIKKIISSIENIGGYSLDKGSKEQLRMHFLEFISRLRSDTILFLYNKIILTGKKKEAEKANKICRSIETILGVDCPNAEYVYITLLLSELEKKKRKKESKKEYVVFLISHGNSTATSMADFANSMFGENMIIPVDMPIFQSIHETLEILMEKLKRLKYQKIIMMVDMGSLVYFGDIISKKYQVETLLVQNINSPLLLEIARAAICQRADFNEMIEVLNETDAKYELFEGREEESHKLLIISCISGAGMANTIKRFIEDVLEDYYMPNLRLLVAEHDEIQSLDKLSKYINKGERICGIIGTFRTDLPDIPFIYLDQLFSREGVEMLMCMIELGATQEEKREFIEDVTKKMTYNMTLNSVTEYVTLLNSERVLNEIKEVYNKILKKIEIKDKQKIEIPFLVHCSCMIERLVVSKEPLDMPKNKEKEIDGERLELIKEAFDTVEKIYDINITEGELYYISLILMK